MPVPSMLYVFAVELLLIDMGRLFQIPAPCRISSIPKGAQLRPGIYPMIEDIVGVDGAGGTEYREALNRRYEASHGHGDPLHHPHLHYQRRSGLCHWLGRTFHLGWHLDIGHFLVCGQETQGREDRVGRRGCREESLLVFCPDSPLASEVMIILFP
jgi:hypothetical protein